MKTLTNETKITNSLLTRALCAAALSLLLACSAVPSTATTVINDSRSNIKNNVAFSQLGPVGTLVSDPFVITGADGLQITGSFSGGGNGEVLSGSSENPTESLAFDGGVEWIGDFTVGDSLLWTNNPGQGPVTFTFSSPVAVVGTQLQSDFYGSFVASIAAYDSNGNLLGYFTEAGVSNGNRDGSAIFLGVQDSVSEISAVTFGITSCAQDCSDFATNELGYTVNATPEPGTLALLGPGVLGLGGFLRRRLLG